MTATGYVSTTGDARKVNKAGDTMTGDLVLNDSSPDTATSAAPKTYVDTGLAGKASTTHASTHAAAGSDPVTLTQAQITGLVSALAALLPLAGGTMTGDLTVNGANLTVKRADNTGAYRLRVTGGALDLEIGGLDVTVSAWSAADFTGTQSNVLRLESAGPHLIGRTQFGTTPFDTVHDIDAAGNKLGFHGATAVARQTVTGSRGGNAALASLLTALANLGLITDGTTA